MLGRRLRHPENLDTAQHQTLMGNRNLSSGPVAQWIRHRPTEPRIAGSSPAGVIFETWNQPRPDQKAAMNGKQKKRLVAGVSRAGART